MFLFDCESLDHCEVSSQLVVKPVVYLELLVSYRGFFLILFGLLSALLEQTALKVRFGVVVDHL